MDFEVSYPEIPDLTDEPALFLVYWAEGHIPRAENGAILAAHMVDWLALHGVTDRSEILLWEDLFWTIGSFRARIQEELMPVHAGSGEEQEDHGD